MKPQICRGETSTAELAMRMEKTLRAMNKAAREAKRKVPYAPVDPVEWEYTQITKDEAKARFAELRREITEREEAK